MYSSDVNERLPRFREAATSINFLKVSGALEDVADSVVDYLDAMEPVGLDDQGQLVIPSDMDPVETPPVLMMLPGEGGLRVRFPGGDVARGAINRAIRATGVRISEAAEIRDRDVKLHNASGYISLQALMLTPPNDQGPHVGFAPDMIVMGAGYPSYMLGSYMAHELDHWDFLTHDEYLAMQEKRRLSIAELITISEKRAYGTSYKIEDNLYTYDKPQYSLDNLARHYEGIMPQNGNLILNGLRVVDADKRHGVAPAALAAKVFERLYGSPDELVTADEVTAFKSAGLVSVDA